MKGFPAFMKNVNLYQKVLSPPLSSLSCIVISELKNWGSRKIIRYFVFSTLPGNPVIRWKICHSFASPYQFSTQQNYSQPNPFSANLWPAQLSSQAPAGANEQIQWLHNIKVSTCYLILIYLLYLYIHVMLADPAIQSRLPLGRNKQISIYLSIVSSHNPTWPSWLLPSTSTMFLRRIGDGNDLDKGVS